MKRILELSTREFLKLNGTGEQFISEMNKTDIEEKHVFEMDPKLYYDLPLYPLWGNKKDVIIDLILDNTVVKFSIDD